MEKFSQSACFPKRWKIVANLKSLRKIKKLKLLEFKKIASTLYHAAMVIPGGRGLFTTIWVDMANCKKNWITITPALDQVLRYFKWIFKEIANKPIQVAQLVPFLLDLHGYPDACKNSAGGVCIIPQHDDTNKFIVCTCYLPPYIVLLFEQGTI